MSKLRGSKSKGVHCTFQAFCKPCGWQGAHWMGEGAAKSAHSEYHWHKDQQSHKDRENALAEEIMRSNTSQRKATKDAAMCSICGHLKKHSYHSGKTTKLVVNGKPNFQHDFLSVAQAERDRMDNRHLPVGPAACRED